MLREPVPQAGLGFAFFSFLNAGVQSGIELILNASGLEKELEKADIVITGEGQLDEQTMMGKVPVGIAALAKKEWLYGNRFSR